MPNAVFMLTEDGWTPYPYTVIDSYVEYSVSFVSATDNTDHGGETISLEVGT